MNNEGSLEQIIDAAVARLLDGEPLEQVLAAYPEHAAELRPALEPAARLIEMPRYEAALEPRIHAMRRMLDQVEASARGEATGAGAPALPATFASGAAFLSRAREALRSRPVAFRGVAVVGAAVLFGALALGASAAAGTTPEPVRNFFGISSSSVIKVELRGVIESVDTTNGTLMVNANGDLRTVIITQDTELSGPGDDLAVLQPGLFIKVEGTLQPDNSILAREIDLEDDDDHHVGPTPGIDPTQAAPTPFGDDDDDGDDDDHDDDVDDDGHDDDDDDRSGPSENSGPGNAGDDDHDDGDDDNSGPGNGDDGHDDDGDDDNSGPGDGEDDDHDDDRDDDKDDDDDDDGRSGGRGGGDDDEDDGDD